jgi:peptidoglycan/LPS O-acetylase OafA/YrhL
MYFRWVFCLILGITIPFFAEISFTSARVVANTIAKYSYGIYLTHTTAMTIGFLLLRNHLAQWLVFLALATALPLLMFHLIEHPGIQAGKKIANWLWDSPHTSFHWFQRLASKA